jgi:transmembrane sensor
MEDWELIVKYIQGNCSISEKETVEQWIKTSKANSLVFNEIKETFELTGKLNQPITVNKTEAWQSIQHKITEEQKIIPLHSQKTNRTTWIFRAAAILIFGFFATWFIVNSAKHEDLLVVETTTELKTIRLPDGTKVTLNKNSKLSYPNQFSDTERRVELTGEAFFNVSKNPNQAFIIKNESFNIKVIGTSFNVLSSLEKNKAIVTVVTGTVAFMAKKGESILLVKDEVGVLNLSNQQLSKSINLDENFLAWQTKKIVFNNTSLLEVVKTLEAYFSIQVKLKNKSLATCKFTGSFENPKLTDVLNVLEKTLNLKIDIKSQQVEFDGKGC